MSAALEARRVAADPLTWVLAVALIGLVVVQWVVVGSADASATVLERILFGVLANLLLAGVLAFHVRSRRWVAVGALIVAASPTVLTLSAAGERNGAIAMAAAGAVSIIAVLPRARWRAETSGVALAVGAVVVVAAVVLWWGAGESRVGPGPGWSDIVAATGTIVRSGFAVLGAGGVPLPLGAELAWWVSIGLVVGAAVVTDRPMVAAAPLIAMAVFVMLAWMIIDWRGPVEAAGGTWIVAGAVAWTGAVVEIAADAERRIGGAITVIGVTVWGAGFVRLVRSVDGSPVAIALVVVATVLAAAVLVVGNGPSRRLAPPAAAS